MNIQNFQTKKFFLYARKSTGTEERQVRSIDDQIAELKELAAKENLTIAKIFVEKQTAKEPGRPIFNQMLADIEKGEADGILSWHPDRLARNSVDGGRLIYLLDTGKLTNLKFPTFWFENTPQGKFMLQIAFGQSKYYVDNLSENIKRGHRQKLKNGLWPQMAPLGYLNEKNTKTIVVDKQKASLIKKAFELYSTGKHSFRELRDIINGLGLIGRKQKTLSISNYQYLLKNPFYYGVIRYNGELYEGKHKPIIAKKLFDKVQEVMQTKSRPNKQKKHYFVFRGFIRCAECGCMITAQTQKGHIYYNCTKRKTKCSQPYIREENLAQQISQYIQKVSLPDTWAAKIIAELKKEHTEVAQVSTSFAQKIDKEILNVEKKVERLTSAYLEGALTLEEYQQLKNNFVEQKHILRNKKTSFEQKGSNWFEPAIEFVKRSKYAKILAKSGNLEAKRNFLQKLGLNFQILNQKLVFDFKNPWKILAFAEPDPPQDGEGEAEKSEKEKMRRGWDLNPRYP